MPQVKAYHRPKTVDAAAHLLARPQVNTTLVAGGTYINAHMPDFVEEVVDLQAVGLNQWSEADGTLTLGSMVRLQDIVDSSSAPELLRHMAHREGPNTFRHAATIGGVIAGADPESELLAALLVFEAMLTIQTAGRSQTTSVADYLADKSALLGRGVITQLSLPTTGKTAAERVARTPADKPIVAALARLDEADTLHVALCGVADSPILVDPAKLDSLTPPADFRGSTAYRQQMATVLVARVIEQLQSV